MILSSWKTRELPSGQHFHPLRVPQALTLQLGHNLCLALILDPPSPPETTSTYTPSTEPSEFVRTAQEVAAALIQTTPRLGNLNFSKVKTSYSLNYLDLPSKSKDTTESSG